MYHITDCNGKEQKMFCNKCGAENPENIEFCSSCGTFILTENVHESTPDTAYIHKHKRKGLWTVILSLAVLLAAFVVIAVLNGGEFSFTTARFTDTVMASQIDLQSLEPITATDVFPKTADVIYVTTFVKNVPPGTKVSAVWVYIPTGETLEGDPEILNGDAQIQFNVTMTNDFTTGEYKVELFINNKVKKTLYFKVE
jgi:hypothetical protein